MICLELDLQKRTKCENSKKKGIEILSNNDRDRDYFINYNYIIWAG